MHNMSFFLAVGCDSNTLDDCFFSLFLATREVQVKVVREWGVSALLVLLKCPLLGRGWWCCSALPP